MINIRPVSDLRNKFTDIEKTVSDGEPVFLTKNGYGSMVVMSIDQYAKMTDDIEVRLDEADKEAAGTDVRYSADKVFGSARRRLRGEEAI